MSMKNPLTPAGIEPATFLFVAQHLNHCATAPMHCSHKTASSLAVTISILKFENFVTENLVQTMLTPFCFISDCPLRIMLLSSR